MIDFEHDFDYLASADFKLDQERDHFPCRTCGSRMPAIIEGPYCSDCPDKGDEIRANARELFVRMGR